MKKPTKLDPIAASYMRDMMKLVREYRNDINTELVPLVKQLAPETSVTTDAWNDTIEAVLERLRVKWLSGVGKFREIASSFVRLGYNSTSEQVKIGIDVFGQSQRMSDYLSAATSQNVSLIRSIPERYHARVENTIIGNMRQAMRSSYIVKELSEDYGITMRQARTIARDQTSKIRGELTRVRQLDSGYEFFKWETGQDERVRHSHDEVSKRDVGYGPGLFRWDNLPIVDGEPSYPGSPINCRCFAKPIRKPKES